MNVMVFGRFFRKDTADAAQPAESAVPAFDVSAIQAAAAQAPLSPEGKQTISQRIAAMSKEEAEPYMAAVQSGTCEFREFPLKDGRHCVAMVDFSRGKAQLVMTGGEGTAPESGEFDFATIEEQFGHHFTPDSSLGAQPSQPVEGLIEQ